MGGNHERVLLPAARDGGVFLHRKGKAFLSPPGIPECVQRLLWGGLSQGLGKGPMVWEGQGWVDVSRLPW